MEKKNRDEAGSHNPFSMISPEVIDEAIKSSPAFQSLSNAFSTLTERFAGLERQVNQVIPVLQKIDAAINQFTQQATQTKETAGFSPEDSGAIAEATPPWLKGLGYLFGIAEKAKSSGSSAEVSILDAYFKGREHERGSMKDSVSLMGDLIKVFRDVLKETKSKGGHVE